MRAGNPRTMGYAGLFVGLYTPVGWPVNSGTTKKLVRNTGNSMKQEDHVLGTGTGGACQTPIPPTLCLTFPACSSTFQTKHVAFASNTPKTF